MSHCFELKQDRLHVELNFVFFSAPNVKKQFFMGSSRSNKDYLLLPSSSVKCPSIILKSSWLKAMIHFPEIFLNFLIRNYGERAFGLRNSISPFYFQTVTANIFVRCIRLKKLPINGPLFLDLLLKSDELDALYCPGNWLDQLREGKRWLAVDWSRQKVPIFFLIL